MFSPDLKLADAATTLAGYGITDGATKAELKAAVDGLLSGAPGALNTLQELAAALGNDNNFAATVTNKLASKADKSNSLAGYGITDGATKDELKAAVDGLVSGAPGALNTLQELAAALGNDNNFDATVTNKLASKADKSKPLGGYGINTLALAERQIGVEGKRVDLGGIR
ncbi:hypothetical protein C3E98_036895, partial [Pseudomonas sp. MWU13-2625]